MKSRPGEDSEIELNATHTAGYGPDAEEVAVEVAIAEQHLQEADRQQQAEIGRCERRNLLNLAAHQMISRMGWVFKTETVIMPAFLDLVSGAGWMRGMLPVLNRFGQSVPPAIFSRRLLVMRRKKWALTACTFLLAVPFAILSIACLQTGYEQTAWMAPLFLVMYGAFFILNGMNNLSYDTVQGKLIRPARRGRLVSLASGLGSIPPVILALLIMAPLLEQGPPGFVWIYALIAICFVAGGVAALNLREPADHRLEKLASMRQHFAGSWHILRSDANFRRLAVASMLFATVLLMFPHYQAYGREAFGLSGGDLMLWVVVQNMSMGAGSMLMGRVADMRGNRIVLTTLFFLGTTAPLVALGLGWLAGQQWLVGEDSSQLAGRLFWIIFIPLGLTPLTQRTLINYTLEISTPGNQPRYLSTLSLCAAVPICASPLVGALIDLVGFRLVLLAAAGVIALSGVMTLRLLEPRQAME